MREEVEAIQQRYSQHTLSIFERLEIKVYDFWIDQTGLPKLYYVMEYKDMEDRQRLWGAFQTRPGMDRGETQIRGKRAHS